MSQGICFAVIAVAWMLRCVRFVLIILKCFVASCNARPPRLVSFISLTVVLKGESFRGLAAGYRMFALFSKEIAIK